MSGCWSCPARRRCCWRTAATGWRRTRRPSSPPCCRTPSALPADRARSSPSSTATPAATTSSTGGRGGRRRWASAPEGHPPAEVVGHVREGQPLHPAVPADVVEDALEHEQHLRPAGDVGVDGEGEDRVVHLPVHPVELVLPQLLDDLRGDETSSIRAATIGRARRDKPPA